jgi:uncharacterized protein
MTAPVFLDSSFWIAYRDGDQEHHREAGQILMALFRQRTQFITTLPVICEIHAPFSRRRKIRKLILEDFWNNPVLRTEDVSRDDETSALELLRANEDKTYSLCDALSFVIMRRLNLRRAVSFDRHFRQFGEFEIIPDKFP